MNEIKKIERTIERIEEKKCMYGRKRKKKGMKEERKMNKKITE